ncbi:MAG: NAD(P)/FAD-dependent oxidoreductase [Pseudomonadales bacterium]
MTSAPAPISQSEPNPTTPHQVDAVIVGAGIAGLWLANLLQQRGYAIVVLEADAVGGAQTLASQGMIHGGLKYALGGSLTGASEAIAAMPGRWAACLAGGGDIDLAAVSRLSSRYYLFAEASGLGKLTSFFASRALRGRVERLPAGAQPPAFADFRGVVYALNDFVLDTESLLAALLQPVADRVYRQRLQPEALRTSPQGFEIELNGARILARRLLLSAGAGAQPLLERLATLRPDAPPPAMQLRPLHQVIVRDRCLPPLYGHCLTGIRRPEPRLTITSHPDGDGWLWYLGGQIAGDGVAMSTPALIEHARAELRACVPWIDWTEADISTLRIDRAEPAEASGRRPDQAFAQTAGACIVAWPTKLSLAPDLGDRVLSLLPPPAGLTPPPLNLPRARVGRSPWSS